MTDDSCPLNGLSMSEVFAGPGLQSLWWFWTLFPTMPLVLCLLSDTDGERGRGQDELYRDQN